MIPLVQHSLSLLVQGLDEVLVEFIDVLAIREGCHRPFLRDTQKGGHVPEHQALVVLPLPVGGVAPVELGVLYEKRGGEAIAYVFEGMLPAPTVSIILK